MLTSTYTLVALSIEQASARHGLQALLERWQAGGRRYAEPSRCQLELACDALRLAFDNCHWRKLDRFVIPALRRAGAVQALLAELDALTLAAIEARADAHAAAAVQDPGFADAVQRCCTLLLQRLEREERELFPLARTHVPSEVWFAIANQMMAHEAWRIENRGCPAGPMPAAAMARHSTRQGPFLAAPHHGASQGAYLAAH